MMENGNKDYRMVLVLNNGMMVHVSLVSLVMDPNVVARWNGSVNQEILMLLTMDSLGMTRCKGKANMIVLLDSIKGNGIRIRWKVMASYQIKSKIKCILDSLEIIRNKESDYKQNQKYYQLVISRIINNKVKECVLNRMSSCGWNGKMVQSLINSLINRFIKINSL